MCCDLIFVFLVCKHVGEMVQEKGRNPMPYQVMMGIGWIGGGLIGGICGLVVGVLIDDGGDAVGLGAALGYALGIACGAGPAYLLAMNVTRDPNYRPPMPVPGTSPYGPSPYGPPPGALGVPTGNTNPYAPPSVQSPFAENSVAAPSYQPAAPQLPAGATPGLPQFLPSSAFAPANPGPKRVQFYCPAGHLLEEWSTSAGQQRRCPHCGGVATVPSG